MSMSSYLPTLLTQKKIRNDLKAWSTKVLKRNFDACRMKWWAERGSIRYLNSEDDLNDAIVYVRDLQDEAR